MNLVVLREPIGKTLLFTHGNLTFVRRQLLVREVVSPIDQLVGEAGCADHAHEETEDEQQTIMEATDVSERVPKVVSDSLLHELSRIDAETDPVAPGFRRRRPRRLPRLLLALLRLLVLLLLIDVVKPGVCNFEIVLV